MTASMHQKQPPARVATSLLLLSILAFLSKISARAYDMKP